jgi:hypothetical protein
MYARLGPNPDLTAPTSGGVLASFLITLVSQAGNSSPNLMHLSGSIHVMIQQLAMGPHASATLSL